MLRYLRKICSYLGPLFGPIPAGDAGTPEA